MLGCGSYWFPASGFWLRILGNPLSARRLLDTRAALGKSSWSYPGCFAMVCHDLPKLGEVLPLRRRKSTYGTNCRRECSPAREKRHEMLLRSAQTADGSRQVRLLCLVLALLLFFVLAFFF